MEVLSSENSENLQFNALTDLCTEIGVRLGNSIFANHERVRLDMKKQTEELSKKCDFFDDEDDKKDVKIKKESDTEMDETETIPHVSPRRENDIDDSETIVYASPKTESEDKIGEKYIRNQNLKLPLRLKNKP